MVYQIRPTQPAATDTDTAPSVGDSRNGKVGSSMRDGGRMTARHTFYDRGREQREFQLRVGGGLQQCSSDAAAFVPPPCTAVACYTMQCTNGVIILFVFISPLLFFFFFFFFLPSSNTMNLCLFSTWAFAWCTGSCIHATIETLAAQNNTSIGHEQVGTS